MASVSESFEQVLNTVQQIKSANPNWSEEQVIDYFRFKNDLLNSSKVIDEQTGDIISLAEAVLINADNISDNADAIQDNADAIQDNADEIDDLEFRAFGSTPPPEYQETGAYSRFDYVTYPGTSPYNYYQAVVDIAAPAGVFDPAKWAKASIQDTREQALAVFVAAGYGSIGVDVPDVMGTIDSTFQNLSGYDIDLIPNPLDVTYDKANDGLSLGRLGIWEFNVQVTIEFDELNSGRIIEFQSYNDTTGSAGTYKFEFFVGRNQGGVNAFVSIPIEVDDVTVSVGDLIQLQVGSTSDTFTNATNIGTIYTVKHISERQEPLTL